MKDSPAQTAGVQVGDLIVFVGVGETRQSVHDLGYDIAVGQMQGVKGTVASFTVYRPNGNEYEVKEFSITRSEFTNWSVSSHRCTIDGYGDVGIVRIMQFDLTTPAQFCEAVDELLAAGCDRIVFDVRNNPGGDRKSIEAVLSYFLKKGDVIIRTKDRDGNEDASYVKAVSYTNEYAGCSVSESDIGKYRDTVKPVVLCNGNTASAAELFTAAFRDYGLAKVVGTTTYGKGSMQSIMSLARFGCPGALKLTTEMYYPPLGDSYEGIGIVPDVVKEQGEEAAKINVYEIRDHEDDQLVEALKHF
jgi:carboxyl-terminal processing protease